MTMDMMAAAMGGGGSSKYAPKEKETIEDKYTTMLAADNLTPAHRATVEKMAARRRDREAREAAERTAAIEASVTPAHRAATAGDAAALAAAGSVACLEVVHGLGAPGVALLLAPDDAGDTPAHLAAAADGADALRQLHGWGALPGSDGASRTPLHAAVSAR